MSIPLMVYVRNVYRLLFLRYACVNTVKLSVHECGCVKNDNVSIDIIVYCIHICYSIIHCKLPSKN